MVINQWIRMMINGEWQALINDFSAFLIQLVLLTLAYLIVKHLLRRIYRRTGRSVKKGPENQAKRFSRIRIRNLQSSLARQRTLQDILFNASNYLLNFTYIYLILSLFGFPMSTIIAGAGILSVAFGLAAQNFVKDVINGYFILLERQFEIGDEVQIFDANIEGTVLKTGIRMTIIKSFEGDYYYIPNSLISIVKNASRDHIRVTIDLPLRLDINLSDYMTSIQTITDRAFQAYQSDLTQEPQIYGLINNTPYGFNYRINFYTQHGQQYRLSAELYALYIQSLQELGLPLAQAFIDQEPIS